MSICLNCENEFKSKTVRAKFCSDLCRATFHQNTKNSESGGLTITIYALIKPGEFLPFYVGKTVGSLAKRLSAHIKDKEGNIQKMRVIKEIVDAGRLPEIKELESIICIDEAQEIAALMKEQYWVEHYVGTGATLYNVQGMKNELKPRLLSTYAKATHRTDPKGIRFDPEKLAFVKKQERLESNQQVVDLLVNKYWWEHKMPVPTHKEAPPLYLKEAEVQSSQPRIGPPHQPVINPFEAYISKIQQTTYSGDLQKVMKEIEVSGDLGAVNKAKLRAFADNHRTNFTN
jgi:hypothetical protein